ncbi:hypothetical protein L7F22_015792 [Adiantum nelumboides]|nr:hypothetical protein [Adiantum nelumboides]
MASLHLPTVASVDNAGRCCSSTGATVSPTLWNRGFVVGKYASTLKKAWLQFHYKNKYQYPKQRAFEVVMEAHNQSVFGGAMLDDVPHLSDWLPDLKAYPSPLQYNSAYSAMKQYFVDPGEVVARNVVEKFSSVGDGMYFRRAGPSEKVYFKPEEVHACIVTCGGLCPGLNTVIREIVCGLWNQFGVENIIGMEGGYRGFYASNTIQLDPKIVNDIHKRGGTILGTSRGGHHTTKIVNSIQDRGINQVKICIWL